MAERRYTTIFAAALVTAAVATFGIYRVLEATKAQNHIITRPVVIALEDVSEGKLDRPRERDGGRVAASTRCPPARSRRSTPSSVA